MTIDKRMAILLTLLGSPFSEDSGLDPKINLASIEEFSVILVPVTFVMMPGQPLVVVNEEA